MIEICRFDPLQAKPSHEGTILADDVVPPSLHPPFEHAYGYLLNNRSMLGHQHPTDEIYVVTSGLCDGERKKSCRKDGRCGGYSTRRLSYHVVYRQG